MRSFYHNHRHYFKRAFEFLTEVIKNPNVNEGSFDPSTVENEKRSLKQRIQSIYDDKMKYSNFRLNSGNV